MINPKLKKIFVDLLGEGIEFKPINKKLPSGENAETDKIFKELFVGIINKWRTGWRMQSSLFDRYGIDLSGYDVNLYTALENLLLYCFGYIRAQIIMGYLYGEKTSENQKFEITDKHGKITYISNDEELYDFVQNLNDNDYLIKEDNNEE